MNRNWKNQFGEAYDVPAQVTAFPQIIDTSWGNDACPTFTLPKFERLGDTPTVALCVEHPDKAQREFTDWNRFVVQRDDGQELYNGDNVLAALEALNTAGPLKFFRSTTKVEGMAEPMVDWYEGGTEAEARAAWDEDCHRYGVPMDKASVVFVECDRETLKPIAICQPN